MNLSLKLHQYGVTELRPRRNLFGLSCCEPAGRTTSANSVFQHELVMGVSTALAAVNTMCCDGVTGGGVLSF
jgi:hypothetical protein